MFTKFLEFQPDLWIFTKFMKWIVTKFQLINDCPCTNFKIIWKAISILNVASPDISKLSKKEVMGNTFMIRKWGCCWDLLLSKGTTTLFGPCCDVKCRSTSAAKKWKYAMANFTLTDQKSIINLTQFEAIIWAKHNTKWQSNKWKIITFF